MNPNHHRTSFAYHEAGHTALSILLLGYFPRLVSIHTEPDESYGGLTLLREFDSKPESFKELSQQEQVKRICMVALAGRAAEEKYLGIASDPSVDEKDVVYCHHLLEHVLLPGEHTTDLMDHFYKEVQAILAGEEVWNIIITISDLLLKHYTLTEENLIHLIPDPSHLY